MILSNSYLLHNHPVSASDSGHSQAARSPTLSALPPSFPAAHTGPLSSSDFCTGFTLTLLCLHHPCGHHSCPCHPCLASPSIISFKTKPGYQLKESYEILMKEIKDDTDEMIYHVLGLIM